MQDDIDRLHASCRHLKAGVKERWEVSLVCPILSRTCEADSPLQKTLRDVLRTYYCFIPHSLHRQRDHFYTCDPAVDPSLKRQSGFKRAWGSETPGPSSVATSTGTGSMSPFLPNLINRDLTEKIDEPITAFELEVSEVYEQQADARSGGVLYCQACGPVLLQRQRWDGRIRTRKVSAMSCIAQNHMLRLQ